MKQALLVSELTSDILSMDNLNKHREVDLHVKLLTIFPEYPRTTIDNFIAVLTIVTIFPARSPFPSIN